jgi:hypothetical protein
MMDGAVVGCNGLSGDPVLLLPLGSIARDFILHDLNWPNDTLDDFASRGPNAPCFPRATAWH